ncbi:Sodium/calcium exchanger protein-domain-containing protein [Polychytrium aggregatum]|uniref:Sodium/calcium exchanger protein-domain-containing protein n=1 Tax=Polychytrium aggregatum TaxID=110093 RepID=UPI0022FE062B|nr:Sodium/calcium exchanger protein-domain-containing protein [Polychytrium aggregatum]KAI9205859.1 Sodium/calcium exchanger protein-domain-containing protein [Polychytrium aggregatum]
MSRILLQRPYASSVLLLALALVLLAGSVAGSVAGSSAGLSPLEANSSAGLSPLKSLLHGSECVAPPASEADACAFVREHCPSPESGLLNYMKIYYCTFGQSTFGFGIMLLWLIYIFILFGTAAESYFCPNLSYISSSMLLSQTVSGVTLAALGNGAPDLFSTFSALDSGSVSMALGELLGAATFITLGIVGVVAFISPFQFPRRPFVRDLVFFIFSIIWILIIINDGFISQLESIFLILYYCVYVAVVVIGNIIYRRQKAARNAAAILLDDVEEPDWIEDSDEVDGLIPNPTAEQRGLDGDFFTRRSILGLQTTSLPREFGRRRDGIPSIRQPGGSWSFSDSNRQSRTNIFGLFSPVTQHQPGYSLVPPAPEEVIHARTRDPDFSNYYVPPPPFPWTETFHDLFPIFRKWHRVSLVRKAWAIIQTPIQFLLTLTIPVVGEEEGAPIDVLSINELESLRQHTAPDDELFLAPGVGSEQQARYLQSRDGHLQAVREDANDVGDDLLSSPVPFDPEDTVVEKMEGRSTRKEIVYLQMCFGPLFAAWAIWGHSTDSLVLLYAKALLFSALFVGLAYLLMGRLGIPLQRLGFGLSVFGFLYGVVWIYVIANEVVELLRSFGLILSIDEAILGMTVFAIGNSLGDLVTNITIARMGFPAMAVGACYGAPMLNIILGLGVSSFYQTYTSGQSYPVTASATVRRCCFILLAVLVGALVVIPLMNFNFDRQIGTGFLLGYVLVVSLSILGSGLGG